MTGHVDTGIVGHVRRNTQLAALREAPAVIELDNVTHDIRPYDSLCSVLTSELYAGRKQHGLDMKAVGTRALFLSSGNNVGPVGDMVRRCVSIHLDAGCELPVTRPFVNERLLEDVRSKRATLVSDALTVVRAWIEAGRPRCARGALAGFGEWSDLCREPLVWLGKPDPAGSVFAAMVADPQRERLGALLEMIEHEFGRGDVSVKDLIERGSQLAAAGQDELSELLIDIASEGRQVNRRKLGHWMARHAGQIVDGRRIVKADVVRNSQVWRIERR
jgi:hypothetical protein